MRPARSALALLPCLALASCTPPDPPPARMARLPDRGEAGPLGDAAWWCEGGYSLYDAMDAIHRDPDREVYLRVTETVVYAVPPDVPGDRPPHPGMEVWGAATPWSSCGTAGGGSSTSSSRGRESWTATPAKPVSP